MRSIGSIYLVVATWAFLVLPTCPCQLLMAFGIDVHGTLRGAQQVSWVSEAGGYPIGHCRCEDEVAQSAEVVDPSVDGEAVWIEADSAVIDFGYLVLSPRLAQLGVAIVQPPPADGSSWLSESERLCVYRL